MTITIDAALEERVREVAARVGQDPDGYIRTALQNQLSLDEHRSQTGSATDAEAARREHDARLWQEFADAAKDPMFLADIADTDQAFQFIDSETARLISHD